MNSIAAYATYTPRYRLTREAAREAWPQLAMPGRSKAVPALDEDPLTMAAHAGLLALEAGGLAGDELAGVMLATTSSPYAVKSGAAVVADYVDASPTVCVLDVTSGTHAGLLALVTALRDTELAQRGPILVVGADAVHGPANDASDLAYGAGAVAFVVAREGFAALEGFDHGYSSYSNTWRPAGETVLQRYDDDRFDRSAGYAPQMQSALGRTNGEPDWYALSLPANGRVDAVPGDRLVGSDLVQRIGDAGCANALLNLAAALDGAEAGQTIAALAYGAGAGTVGARIVVTAGVRAAQPPNGDVAELSYVQYAKHRGLIPLTQLPDFGAPYGASPGWERTKRASVGLRGGRCRACGSLNFPPRDYCLDCRGQEFEPVALPRRGSVLTFNLQYVIGIGPEEAPLPICTALLDGEPEGRYGGKVAALVAGTSPNGIDIGTSVRLIPRRGDVEEGLVKYGWKWEVAA